MDRNEHRRGNLPLPAPVAAPRRLPPTPRPTQEMPRTELPVAPSRIVEHSIGASFQKPAERADRAPAPVAPAMQVRPEMKPADKSVLGRPIGLVVRAVHRLSRAMRGFMLGDYVPVNAGIYNAALTGFVAGASQTRPVTSAAAEEYASALLTEAKLFAQAVDSAIAFDPTLSQADIDLVEGIASNTIALKYPIGVTQADFESTANAIAVIYTETSASLFSVAGPIPPPVFSQTVWYVDPVSGNDANDGFTAVTAIQTWTTKPDGSVGEYVARTGTSRLVNITADYYLLSDMPSTDMVSFLGIAGPNCLLRLHGVPSVTRSGTLSAITHRAPTTNTRDALVDGVVDWTADVGSLVRVNTGTTIDYEGNIVGGPTFGFVMAALSGPNAAGMSIMCSSNVDPFQGNFFMWPGPFPVGATYDVLSLPTVPNIFIDPRLGSNLNDAVIYNLIELVNVQEFLTIPPDIGYWTMQHCVFSAGASLAGGTFMNCQHAGGGSGFFGYVNTIFGYCPPGGFMYGFDAVWFSYGFMLQGPATQILMQGPEGVSGGFVLQNHHASFGLGIYDCDSPIVVSGMNAIQNESSVYGSGITTCVYNIAQNGAVFDNNAYTIARPYARATGAPSDIIINNQTSLPAMDPTTYALTGLRALTFANLFTSVAGGGFEGIAFDPRAPATCYQFAHP